MRLVTQQESQFHTHLIGFIYLYAEAIIIWEQIYYFHYLLWIPTLQSCHGQAIYLYAEAIILSSLLKFSRPNPKDPNFMTLKNQLHF